MPIYASENFLRAVGDDYGWLGGFDSAGALRCILPYTVLRKGPVRMVRFRVETIPVGSEFGLEEERQFLNEVVRFFRKEKADVIIPATTNTIFRTYPENCKAAPYGTLVVDLTQPEDVLWQNVHSKHKNVIRNATKKGVEIRGGLDYLDNCHALIHDTFARSSMGFMPQDAFVRLVTGLGEQVRVLVALHEGKLQACAVIPFSLHSAYYVYGGTAPRPLSGASNLLQWEAMRLFRSLGVKRYDFCGVRIDPKEGSKQASLVMYKERFGSKLVQGYMWKCQLSRLKGAAYNVAVRLLRGGDIVDKEAGKLDRPATQAAATV